MILIYSTPSFGIRMKSFHKMLILRRLCGQEGTKAWILDGPLYTDRGDPLRQQRRSTFR